MNSKFAVGQDVEFTPPFLKTDVFKVVRQMPDEDSVDVRRYCIKSVKESFERTVTEHQLNAWPRTIFESDRY